MKEPAAPKDTPIPVPRPVPAAGERTANSGQHEVVVRFYRRVQPQRNYPLVVELRPVSRRERNDQMPVNPVRVRPIIPGSLVTPAECPLDPSRSPSASFTVTPLARGKFRDAHVEVHSAGELLQQVPVPMRGSSQCLAKLFFALTLLLPTFLFYVTQVHDLSGTGPIEGFMAPASEPLEASAPAAGPKQPPAKPAPKEPQKNAKKPAEKADSETQRRELPKAPLERALLRNVPDYAVAGPDSALADSFPPVTRNGLASGVQHSYDVLRVLSLESQLVFWVGAGMLGLTVFSWLVHRPVRGSQKGKPLTLPTTGRPDRPGPLALRTMGESSPGH